MAGGVAHERQDPPLSTPEHAPVYGPGGPSLYELAVQALSSTERGYDLLAPRFENTPFCTPPHLVAEVAPHVGFPNAALDLCCGTGVGLRMLQPRCRERLVGLDFSAGMLAEARRRTPDLPGMPPLELVCTDALDLPCEADFDVVTCFGACGHFWRADLPRLVERIHRALRPGGRFVFLTAEPPRIGSPTWLACVTFNAAMAVRNRVLRQPFVMYYLTFLLPEARRLLERQGFAVTVHESQSSPRSQRIVVAIR